MLLEEYQDETSAHLWPVWPNTSRAILSAFFGYILWKQKTDKMAIGFWRNTSCAFDVSGSDHMPLQTQLLVDRYIDLEGIRLSSRSVSLSQRKFNRKLVLTSGQVWTTESIKQLCFLLNSISLKESYLQSSDWVLAEYPLCLFMAGGPHL